MYRKPIISIIIFIIVIVISFFAIGYLKKIEKQNKTKEQSQAKEEKQNKTKEQSQAKEEKKEEKQFQAKESQTKEEKKEERQNKTKEQSQTKEEKKEEKQFQAKEKKKKVILAIVNGENIYKKDIEAALPQDTFAISLKKARESKINRFIYCIMLTQFMKKQKIFVTSEVVEKEIEKLKIDPPFEGCSCCRYESLEKFLEANFMTISELKKMIRANMGFDKYINTLWQQRYPTQEIRDAYIKEKRNSISKNYANVSHIFFNTFQDPDFKGNPRLVLEKKKKLAYKIWKRLEKGENFNLLAQKFSEDQGTKANGGNLGCILRDTFGTEFKKTLSKLQVGKYSSPIISPWGVHIIKLGVITKADLLKILESDFKEKMRRLTFNKLKEKANIERFD